MASDATFEFPPVLNGLDYLTNVVQRLAGEPSREDLKYAVLHLNAATEVLLKVRLIQEHWTLVFKNLDKATRNAFAASDFESCGATEAIDRLRNIADVEIEQDFVVSIKKLARQRNALQHFGVAAQSVYQIEALAARVLDFLISFVMDHLRPTLGEAELSELDAVRAGLGNIRKLVDERMKRLKPDLDPVTDVTVECPDCRQMALVADGSGTAACRFCERAWASGEEAAEDYASGVLGLSWYLVETDGAPAPVQTCPECDQDSLVREAVVAADTANETPLCFSCGTPYSAEGITECSRCGGTMTVSDDETDLCPNCWSHLIASRD